MLFANSLLQVLHLATVGVVERTSTDGSLVRFLGLFGMSRLDIAWSFNICSVEEVNFDCAVSFSTGVDLSTELRFIVVGLTFVASDMEVNRLEFAGVGIGSDCSFECVVAGKQVEVKPTVENNS